jgi:hypothetical protein
MKVRIIVFFSGSIAETVEIPDDGGAGIVCTRVSAERDRICKELTPEEIGGNTRYESCTWEVLS